MEDSIVVKNNNAIRSVIMNTSTSVSCQNKLMNATSQSMEDLSSPPSLEQSKLDQASELVEVVTDDEVVLPVSRPSITECGMRYQSPPKEFVCFSTVSKNTGNTHLMILFVV